MRGARRACCWRGMVSANEFQGFRSRLAALIGADEPFSWARRVGIPSATFDRIWNGGSIPKAETLLRISRFSAVTVDWLLTGDSAARGCRTSIFDEELSAQVAETVVAIHRECGLSIGPGDLGRAIARLCNELAEADLVNWDEKMGALRLAAVRLRRSLMVDPK